MLLTIFIVFSFALLQANALYFLVSEERKCFTFEQPRDTPMVFVYEIMEEGGVVGFDLYYGLTANSELQIMHKVRTECVGNSMFIFLLIVVGIRQFDLLLLGIFRAKGACRFYCGCGRRVLLLPSATAAAPRGPHAAEAAGAVRLRQRPLHAAGGEVQLRRYQPHGAPYERSTHAHAE